MANCIIHPIAHSEFEFYKSEMTYRFNYGQKMNLTVYTWYIEGAGERILVDAGSDSSLFTKRGVVVKDIQTLESGLGKLGITTDDIDLVILTQVHFDHVAEAYKFPRARLLVQKDEIDTARNPHPYLVPAYPKQCLEGLNFEVIDGDTQVCDGVSVIKTPGHTPGGQSVRVETAQGIAVIPGFCCIKENFQPPASFPLPVIPPGIHYDVLKAYDSTIKVKEMADIILPLHEPEFRDKISIP
jgi:glyoxylase-like metal-dependent hydrolase (beta-lactamase superfamily II)